MILCINGKKVGGLTEIDLEVELDLCGPEVIIIVAKYNSTTRVKETESWPKIGRDNLHWHDIRSTVNQSEHYQIALRQECDEMKKDIDVDIDDDISIDKLSQSSVSHTKPESLYENEIENNPYNPLQVKLRHLPDEQNENSKYDKNAKSTDNPILSTRKNYSSEGSMKGVSRSSYSDSQNDLTTNPIAPNESDICKLSDDHGVTKVKQNDVADSFEEESKDWEDDENPWLGCVCGVTHDESVRVFWIQCDSCDAWFNCSPYCIGFHEKDAEKRGQWLCNECSPVIEASLTPLKTNVGTKELTSTETFCTPQIVNRNRQQKKPPLSVGTIIQVADRTWIGSNKPGGAAKILGVIPDKDDPTEMLYNVQYILESRKEYNIESSHITMNPDIIPDFSSPAGSTRNSRGKD